MMEILCSSCRELDGLLIEQCTVDTDAAAGQSIPAVIGTYWHWNYSVSFKSLIAEKFALQYRENVLFLTCDVLLIGMVVNYTYCMHSILAFLHQTEPL